MKRFIIILSALLLLCSSSKPADELKIISFNIRYNSWNNIDAPNGWPSRKEAVVRMINQEKPAAIGLQEALLDQLRYLDSNLPAYRRIGVGRDDGLEAGEFMAIYYDTAQLQLLSSRTLWLSTTPDVPSLGWDAACFRTATVACFRHRPSLRSFYYINTHLDHMGTTARSESVRLIASLLSPSNSGPIVPAIVGGDMNTTILDTALLAFDDAHLSPACAQPASQLCHHITYNAFGKGPGSAIDHFFVRAVNLKDYRILDGNYGVPYLSDHFPVQIVFSLLPQ